MVKHRESASTTISQDISHIKESTTQYKLAVVGINGTTYCGQLMSDYALRIAHRSNNTKPTRNCFLMIGQTDPVTSDFIEHRLMT